MHIDEDVLATVMELTGAASKTEAVRIALNDITRRARFKKLATEGLGLSPAELRNAWEDPFAEETAKVAETPKTTRYAAKRTAR